MDWLVILDEVLLFTLLVDIRVDISNRLYQGTQNIGEVREIYVLRRLLPLKIFHYQSSVLRVFVCGGKNIKNQDKIKEKKVD